MKLKKIQNKAKLLQILMFDEVSANFLTRFVPWLCAIIRGCIPIPWWTTYCLCMICSCCISCCCCRASCCKDPEAFFLSVLCRICVCWMRFSCSCSWSCCIVCSICFFPNSASWCCWNSEELPFKFHEDGMVQFIQSSTIITTDQERKSMYPKQWLKIK